MSALTILTLAATLASAPVLPGDPPPLSHADEIKLFASTLALTSTASNLCADILINQAMVTDLHERLHITSADRPGVGEENRFALQVLVRAIRASGTIKAWCDETYEMYGPKGTMLRELMKR